MIINKLRALIICSVEYIIIDSNKNNNKKNKIKI